MSATVKEVALLKLVQRIPKASAKHERTMLWLHGHKNSYFSLKEIGENTLLKDSELEKILEALEEKKLLEREGCLYKKPEKEKIAEML